MSIVIKEKHLLFLIVLTVILTILSIVNQVSFFLGICVILYFVMVFYCFGDIKNRLALLFYLISFLLFLLGGEITSQYFGYDFENFEAAINNHAYISCIISLLFLWLGFISANSIGISKKSKKIASNENPSTIYIIRKIGLWGIIVTSIPMILKGIESGVYVARYGYLSIYTSFTSSLPTILVSLGQMFSLFLFMYLATLPEKNKCIIPLVLYLMYGISWLFSGRRLVFGVTIMVTLYYIVLRHLIAPKEKWFSKPVAFTVSCFSLLFIVFMYRFKYYRYGINPDDTTFWGSIISFFNQQGVSIDILKYQKIFESNSPNFTSLYYTLRYFRISVVTRHFSGFPLDLYSIKSEKAIYATNNLADYIMYSVSPRKYFQGFGLGTSYIAEAYNDFGYFGIIIWSYFYGFIINKLFSFEDHYDVWRFTISLLILEHIVILPRYGADSIMLPLYNFANIIVLASIIYITNRRITDIRKSRVTND